MNSTTPPPYHRPAASRLVRVNNQGLELALHSPKSNETPSSPISLRSSPLRKRGKTKGGQKGLLASPRNPRRSRPRSESVEEKEAPETLIQIDHIVKPRKQRKTNTTRSKRDKQTSPPLTGEHVCQTDFNRTGEIITDLLMWRDVAKSTLWFGFGCLCFLSSCFAKGLNFSAFSALSNLGLVLLCASFLSNTLSQRTNEVTERVFHVREDDVLRLTRRFLPAANFVIAMTSDLFSGQPSTTLKVTPFLLMGAEYGHLITLWRLSALGFFLSFTIPKLYSCYTHQISLKVERVKTRIGEAWEVFSHKKILAGSTVTAFWNMTSIRTRFFAVFIILVIFRYRRQNLHPNNEGAEPVKVEKQEEETLPQEQEQTQPEEEQALVVAETEGSKIL